MVSIIIPTYNRADLLPRAIDSVINQTYKDWELIIVDDGSTDNTKEIVEEFVKKDPRIKYFYQENKGQGAARNLGIKNAKGEYIAFLDSDDEWLPEKLEKQVKFMDKNKEYNFCYTGDIRLFSDGSKKEVATTSVPDLSYMKLAGIGVSVPSSHMYRRDVFNEVGFFDEHKDLIGLEDNEWSVRAYFLKGACIPDFLAVYRIHNQQITRQNISSHIERQIRGLLYILEKNKEILKKSPSALEFRYMQLGSLAMRAGNFLLARNYWRLFLSQTFSLKILALVVLSYIPFLYNWIIALRSRRYF